MAFHTRYSQEEILEELRRLEESKAFRRAAGLTALLRFIVEAELRGDGPLLKETILGVEVYRRAADYDPKADGIVRVNANRLRARRCLTLSRNQRLHPLPGLPRKHIPATRFPRIFRVWRRSSRAHPHSTSAVGTKAIKK